MEYNHTYYVSEEKVLVHNSENSGCSVETSADSEGGSKTIRYQDYDEISQRSIHNPGKAKAMLGKYDGGGPTSYITRAGDDFAYLKSNNYIWDSETMTMRPY